jgi:hypothetical protein
MKVWDHLTEYPVWTSSDDANRAETIPIVTNYRGDLFCPVEFRPSLIRGECYFLFRRCDLCTQEQLDQWKDYIAYSQDRLKHSEFFITDLPS